jgi:hypothetical protein
MSETGIICRCLGGLDAGLMSLCDNIESGYGSCVKTLGIEKPMAYIGTFFLHALQIFLFALITMLFIVFEWTF